MGASWLARRIGLDGNGLRRRLDRVRVWGTVAAVLTIAGGAPLAAPPVMTLVHDAAVRTAHAEAQHRHRVRAVFPDGAAPPVATTMLGDPPVRVRARWTGPDGRAHLEYIPMHRRVRPGGAVPLWVDDRGRPAAPPLSASQIRGQTTMSGVGAGFGVLAVVGFATLVFRRRLDHRAYDRWEAEWAVLEPRWTRRN